MVAAHAYDLRAAKEVYVLFLFLFPFLFPTIFYDGLLVTQSCSGSGMRTVYVHRSTEDVDEDMDVVRRDVDLFLTADQGGKGPLEQLADLTGVLFVD